MNTGGFFVALLKKVKPAMNSGAKEHVDFFKELMYVDVETCLD
jgi:hypothetical protein